MPANRTESIFFLGLLFLSAGFLIFLFLPYLDAIVLALTFSILFHPLYKRILGFFRGRYDGFVAFFVVVIVALVIIAPATYFAFQIFGELRGIYAHLSSGGGPTLEFFRLELQKLAPLGFDVNQYARQLVNLFINNLGTIFSKIADLAGTFIVALFILYYLLRDGAKVKGAIMRISPLPGGEMERILSKLSLMADAAIRGTLAVAAVQGFFVGIGFFIFGLPNPILWGAVAVIAALVPVFGTALVIAPAAADLFVTGNLAAAIGFTAWGVLAVGLIDNFLRPYLIRQGTQIHTLLVLLSVLGGISIFGLTGFLLGPLVLSLFLALLDMYPVVMKRNFPSRRRA